MRKTPSAGFTLVELLVVIAIIGVLIALLLPAIQAAREAARRSQCTNSLRQISLALCSYESAYGHFPPGRVGYDSLDRTRYNSTSGFVAILPQLELQSLFDSFDFDVGLWTNNASVWLPTNFAAIAQRPPVYICPSDESEPYSLDTEVGGELIIVGANPDAKAAVGSYALVAGSRGAADGFSQAMKYDNNGVFYYLQTMTIEDIPDGLSSTLFVGENVEGHLQNSSNIWTRSVRDMDSHRSTSNPINTGPGDPYWGHINRYGLVVNGAFGSRHPGGANFGFGDGHVEFLSENIDMRVYQAYSTRSGGEVANEDSYGSRGMGGYN